jgi:hypothetical protein
MLCRHLKLLPLFLLFFLLPVRTAEACNCGPTPTVLASFNHADVVVVTAVSVEKATPEQPEIPKGWKIGSFLFHPVRKPRTSNE